MFSSQTITKISEALSKAQKNIGAAAKGAANPFYKSKYADLSSVMAVCKEALNNEGITVLQPVTTTAEGKHAVETVLLHESGEFVSSVMTLELTKTNMQDLGSAISYARRYSLQSLVFIPAEDDDGEKAMTRGTKPEAKVSATSTETASTPPKRTASSFAKKTAVNPTGQAAVVSTPVPVTTVPEASNGAVSGWE